ncbi:MAG: nucleotidyltransferase domain-containing protein [DPANN group archaeon]|nr:nucleotidyltransferase domain-containing protein [DPANN group archaeon]
MKAKLTSKRDHLLWFYLTFPTRVFHLRELSRASGISFPWTRKLVQELVEQELITRKKERNLVLTKANTDGIAFKVLKRAHNLISVYESGLVAYLIDIFGRPECIIFFGSYEKGEDIESSDIDIAVLSKRGPRLDLKIYEKKLLRKISVQILDRDCIEKEFLSTLANGTVLDGYLDIP